MMHSAPAGRGDRTDTQHRNRWSGHRRSEVNWRDRGGLRTRLLLAAGTLAMVALVGLCITGYRLTVKTLSLRLIEEHNVALATAVARELETEFATLLANIESVHWGEADIVSAAVIARNEARLLTLLEDAHVHYFDIHSLSGQAIYTSHPDRVGSSHHDDPDFAAARTGTVTNYLDYRPADAAGADEPHHHLVTFAPIRHPTRADTLGVVGLYAVAEPGTLPYPALKPLLVSAFALAPAALLALAGTRAYRRRKAGLPLLGPHPQGTHGDDAGRCHTIAAQETERKRISRDLHDGIGQYLNAIKIHLQHISSTHESHLPSDARAEIQGVVSVVSSASEEVRRISLALRPAMLDDLGLLATLNWLCREFALAHPEIALYKRVVVIEQDIPDRLKTAVYRILQEALTNVARHSQARRVEIELVRARDGGVPTLGLTITDDGIGFNPYEAQCRERSNGGVGLHSMRERAELDGGTLQIQARKHGGTRINASWPLR